MCGVFTSPDQAANTLADVYSLTSARGQKSRQIIMEQRQEGKFICGSYSPGCYIAKTGQEGQSGAKMVAAGCINDTCYVLSADSVLSAGNGVEIICKCQGESRISGKCVASKHWDDRTKPALNLSICKLDTDGKQITKRPQVNGDDARRIVRRILQPTDDDIAPDTQILVHLGGGACPVAAKVRTIEAVPEDGKFQLSTIHFTCERSRLVPADFGSVISLKDKQDVFAYVISYRSHEPNVYLAAPLWNGLCHLVRCYPDYEDLLGEDNLTSLCAFQISP